MTQKSFQLYLFSVAQSKNTPEKSILLHTKKKVELIEKKILISQKGELKTNKKIYRKIIFGTNCAEMIERANRFWYETILDFRIHLLF